MKENINEHDMTKKMMDIIRNSQRTIIKEADEVVAPVEAPVPAEQSALVPGDDLPEEELGDAKPPKDGREPLIKLDSSYFELDKNDQRFKDLKQKLEDIANVEVTSVYISKNKDLVITGQGLQYQNSGLYFTMALSNKDVVSSSENVEGDEANEIIKKLQGFLKNLRDDVAGTKEFLYDEKLDSKKD